MERLELRMFVTSKAPRDEEVVLRWRELAQSFELPINIEVIEIANDPEQASIYDIIFTPTIIATTSTGKQLRYIGYSKDIDLIIRSCGWYNKSQTITSNVQEILRRNNNILSDTQRMKEESERMRNAAQKIRDQLKKF